MKIPLSRRPQGFTLIELLVVIAIIAVLAGGGFAAGNAAIQKARRTTTLAAATALESAVNNFFLEYGSMPVATGGSDTTVQTDQAPGVNLLRVLLGLEPDGNSMLNPRKIKFLSAKEGNRKTNKNGLIYNTAGTDVEGFFDPWGGAYYVIMDLDYDEKVEPKTKASAKATLNGRRVAAWSNGADGITATGKPTDDVKTWGP